MKYDCLVIGSGFSGSILSMILARNGRKVLLIDRTDHPRFAIGESSTPLADMLLERLSRVWSLPELGRLARFGTWPKQVNCGLKRGFSYFAHRSGEPFFSDACNANQMLVTASANDPVGDTHWDRADVDHLLVRQAIERGVDYRPNHDVGEIQQLPDGSWAVSATDTRTAENRSFTFRADFLVDASGRGGVLAGRMGLADATHSLHTRSTAVYGHCESVPRWADHLKESGIAVEDHPYRCDDAAVHHLLQDGWLWMLRFQNGKVSIGRVWKGDGALRSESSSTAEDPFGIADYPSLKVLLSGASVVAPGLAPQATAAPMQHRIDQVTGNGWAMLPSAAVTLDPLHSSGIALGLASVSRLAAILGSDCDRQFQLTQYGQILDDEIDLMDLLVDGAYLAMPHWQLFCAYCLLYFVAAIACEEDLAMRQTQVDRDLVMEPLWLAGDAQFKALVRNSHQRMVELCCNRVPTVDETKEFVDDLRCKLRRWPQALLFRPEDNGMYRYTSAPK